MVIGITGGIGTGKSTVTKYLIDKGYIVIDADKIARDVINYEHIIIELVKTFGTKILDANNKICRKSLSKIVFADKKNVEILNAIMHPAIIEEINNQINKHKNELIIFVDMPLIFEAHLEYMFDEILLVYATKETQLRRVITRDNKTKEEALKVIESQIDIEEKKKMSDYIIENMSNKETLYNQIEDYIKNINKKLEEKVLKNEN